MLAEDPTTPRIDAAALTPTAMWAAVLTTYLGLALGLTGYVLDVGVMVVAGILLVFPGSLFVRAGLQRFFAAQLPVELGGATACGLSLR